MVSLQAGWSLRNSCDRYILTAGQWLSPRFTYLSGCRTIFQLHIHLCQTRGRHCRISEDILAAKVECFVLLKINGHLLTGACLELTQRKFGRIYAAKHVWHCFGKMSCFTSVRTYPNKFSFQDVFLIILSAFTGNDHYVLFACSSNCPSDSHPSILHHIPPEPAPYKLLHILQFQALSTRDLVTILKAIKCICNASTPSISLIKPKNDQCPCSARHVWCWID